jgi:20S proteasome alpha/beta subunit
VDYVYSHQGQKYASGNAIHKVKQTLALKVGEQVVLIVDRNNPKRAFIRDLYM